MALRIATSVNIVASIVVCRGSRETFVPSSSSLSSSTPTPPISSSGEPIMTMRRRKLVHSTLASLLLMGASPARAVESDFEDWYRYEGAGFALSVPPDFEDIRDPEEFVDGSLYGNKAKPKMFEARFASPDRSEVLSVVVRQSAQLKLTFLAVKDVTDLGSLRDSAKIFVPAGAKLFAARTIKSTDENPNRTYYYYEFASGGNYVALEAGASGGQVYVLGVTAPKDKWKDDYRKLRLMLIATLPLMAPT
ncbi:hypothetical protein GOP47_0013966 [Adiantum capillus-veneris]|uniref:PsbP C-terminal domain-containing protein n=1 Tax=Adiantum capillus-veneris TaxID=13818 RepID=A0A9D4UPI5_ADICA|nr:hypothetical protein GOP47_0013966 [Adiantum capillus-veneris]